MRKNQKIIEESGGNCRTGPNYRPLARAATVGSYSGLQTAAEQIATTGKIDPRSVASSTVLGAGLGLAGRRQKEKISEVAPTDIASKFSKPTEVKAKELQEAYQFYSPNIEERLTFEEAAKRVQSENQARYKMIGDDIDSQLGFKNKSYNAIGDWIDGAENSVFNRIEKPQDHEATRYSAALKGKAGNQKSVINFVSEKGGPDSLYQIDVPIKDVVPVRQTLDEYGIKHRTLVSTPEGQRIVIFDPGTTLESVVEKIGSFYGKGYDIVRGKGEFIGSEASRSEGLRAYNQVIQSYEAFGKRHYRPGGGERLPDIRSAEPVQNFLRSEKGQIVLPFPGKLEEPPSQPFETSGPTFKPEALPTVSAEIPLIAGTGLVTPRVVTEGRPAYRYEKFEGPPEVVKLLQDVAAQEGEFRGARMVKRGSDITRMARELNITPQEVVERLVSAEPGAVANTEFTYRARQVLLQEAQKLRQFQDKIDMSVATPEQIQYVKDQMMLLSATAKRLSGMRTEASNLLHQWGKPVTANEVETLREMAIDLKQMGMDSRSIEEFLPKTLKSLEPATSDKFWHLWYSSILSGPTTHAKNIIGNLSQMAMEFGRIVATDPANSPSAFYGMVDGLFKGAGEAKDVMRYGRATKFEPGRTQEIRFSGKVSRILNVANYVGRALAAADIFFKEGFRGMELRQLARIRAKKEGLRGAGRRERIEELYKKPTRPIEIAAEEYANYGTYQQQPEGVFGAIASGLASAGNKSATVRFIVPFTRVVANVINNGLDWTPLGGLRAYKWEMNPRQRSQALGRAFLGTLGMSAIGMLAAEDKITGDGPSDPRKRQQLMATGWRPNSLVFTDRKTGQKTYMPYANTFGPGAVPTAVAANFIESMKYDELDEKDALNRASAAMLRTPGLILDMSFLTGVSDTLSALRNYEMFGPSFVQRFAAQQVSSWVPNLVKQTARYFNPAVYDAETILEKIQSSARVSWGLKPKVDIYGDPVIGDRLSGLFPSKETADPVKRFMARNRLWIPVPSKKTTVEDFVTGLPRQMTRGEYYSYIRYSGQAIKNRLRDEIPDIMTEPDAEERQNMVNAIVREERSTVKEEITGDMMLHKEGR